MWLGKYIFPSYLSIFLIPEFKESCCILVHILNTQIKELSKIISYILTLDSMNEEIRPSLVFANKHLKYQNKRYKQKYYKSNTTKHNIMNIVITNIISKNGVTNTNITSNSFTNTYLLTLKGQGGGHFVPAPLVIYSNYSIEMLIKRMEIQCKFIFACLGPEEKSQSVLNVLV